MKKDGQGFFLARLLLEVMTTLAVYCPLIIISR